MRSRVTARPVRCTCRHRALCAGQRAQHVVGPQLGDGAVQPVSGSHAQRAGLQGLRRYEQAFGVASVKGAEVRTALCAGGFASALMQKDLFLAQEAAKAVGAPLPAGAMAHSVYAMMAAMGLGGKDFSVVFEFLRGLPRREQGGK